MKRLPAGIIGLGAMGPHHARSLDDVDSVGIADTAVSDPAALSRPVYRNVEDLLTQGLDCVVMPPTDATHRDVAEQTAAEGLHTSVEKPLSVDTRAAVALSAVFGQAGRMGAVGIERHNLTLQRAGTRTESDQLGDVCISSSRGVKVPFQVRFGRGG